MGTGAHYIAAHRVPRMMDYVREAFHIAKYERRPVVLGIPYDLQKVEHMANQPYETSAMYQPKVGRMHPDPEVVAEGVVGVVLWCAAAGMRASSSPIAAAPCSPTRCPRAVFSTTIRLGSAPPAATSRRWAGRCTSPRVSSSLLARA